MTSCSAAYCVAGLAFKNGIEIKVASHKELGLKEQVEITLAKNGKKKIFLATDFEELDKKYLKNKIEELAFDLHLERLYL